MNDAVVRERPAIMVLQRGAYHLRIRNEDLGITGQSKLKQILQLILSALITSISRGYVPHVLCPMSPHCDCLLGRFRTIFSDG